MVISAKLVKELREKTGAGMMDCKKALVEVDGKIEEAINYLREKGISKAAKKAGRVAAEGLIFEAVSEDEKTGVILEFNSETDFVAKNEEFIKLGQTITDHILNNNFSSIEDLKSSKLNGTTVDETVTNLIAKIGENMSIRRFKKIETDGFACTYIHMGGKIGVIIDAIGDPTKENKIKAKDIAMHAAAMDPRYRDQSEVSQEDLEKEREIERKILIEEGKPEKIIDKILIGKMKKFYEENCLLQQKYVKDDKITVSEYADNLEIKDFTRYLLGEGIEKKEEDFAKEVAAQMKG